MRAEFEAELATMLDAAAGALRTGDAGEAERRAKAISALVRAQREVAEYVAAERARAPDDAAPDQRAEARAGFAGYVADARRDMGQCEPPRAGFSLRA